jgi:hypothetical protein
MTGSCNTLAIPKVLRVLKVLKVIFFCNRKSISKPLSKFADLPSPI